LLRHPHHRTCKLQGIEPIEHPRLAYTSGGLDVLDLVSADPSDAA